MAETKTIVAAKATIGVIDLDASTRDAKGKFTAVEIRHVAAGTPVDVDADEADALIASGVAVEYVEMVPAPPKGGK